MIINDHEAIGASGLAVFGDIRQVASISLPHLTEGIFFKGFAIFEVRISSSFEIVFTDKTLNGCHRDRSWNKRFLDQVIVDLSSVLFVESVPYPAPIIAA